MRKFEKIIGYTIVSIFMAFLIGSFTYSFINEGWKFILVMLVVLAVVGLFLLGVHLVTKK